MILKIIGRSIAMLLIMYCNELIILDNTSRPFFTTDAAVSSHELSIAKQGRHLTKLQELWGLAIREVLR